jgi:beta-N-acetylhexosaminidase
MPSLAELVGQKLVVRMEGTTPSADLLGRIRRGEIGGVILFGSNITSPAQLVALTGALQQAAADGGRPPLLIATDQEGGSINRVTWAPPTMSAPQMGATGSASTALAQGAAAGSALRSLGINVDLAPVADVPASTSSFMYVQGRTFSFDAATTANLSNAFAVGLESQGVEATMKHFPGIGYAIDNTDSHVVTIDESVAGLAPGLLPYRAAIGNGLGIVMLSNATYPAYDPDNAAGWSEAIANDLLRATLGFTGVTMTDSLTGTAVARGIPQDALALEAALAGTDMILVSGSEASTRTVYATLLAAATNGTLSQPSLEASYARIRALKSGF